MQPLPEFGRLDIELTIDEGSAGRTLGNAWLANHTAARNLELKAGNNVTTGARVGPMTATGSHFEARTQILGSVSVKFR